MCDWNNNGRYDMQDAFMDMLCLMVKVMWCTVLWR